MSGLDSLNYKYSKQEDILNLQGVDILSLQKNHFTVLLQLTSCFSLSISLSQLTWFILLIINVFHIK